MDMVPDTDVWPVDQLLLPRQYARGVQQSHTPQRLRVTLTGLKQEESYYTISQKNTLCLATVLQQRVIFGTLCIIHKLIYLEILNVNIHLKATEKCASKLLEMSERFVGVHRQHVAWNINQVIFF